MNSIPSKKQQMLDQEKQLDAEEALERFTLSEKRNPLELIRKNWSSNQYKLKQPDYK